MDVIALRQSGPGNECWQLLISTKELNYARLCKEARIIQVAAFILDFGR